MNNQIIDRCSYAYGRGFDQAFTGREFRNPCAGNERATDNHYFGFKAGETARAKGFANREAYEAAEEAATVPLAEAATDLLNAFDKDCRTVGYRNDLWECLRANLAAA